MHHFAGKADWRAGELKRFESVEPENLDWVELIAWEDDL